MNRDFCEVVNWTESAEAGVCGDGSGYSSVTRNEYHLPKK
jgi:hypothetical protein